MYHATIEPMNTRFSKRIQHVPSSFLREIFKVIADPAIISFAGGLPNAELFPVAALEHATQRVFAETPKEALQYGDTDGVPELRQIIAQSYKEKDALDVHSEHILITNGSQQGLDLLGKVLIDDGDVVVLDSPTYLAAIQALALYEPRFVSTHMQNGAHDIASMCEHIRTEKPKMIYTIPNFQNPTGLTYTNEEREAIASAAREVGAFIIEDDPYGEIRFEGVRQKPFLSLYENTIMLGSFSKIVAPGMRLGWIVAPESVMQKLRVAKQAADLHTSTLVQYIVYRYYTENDTNAHIKEIAAAYKKQKDAMLSALRAQLPSDISYTDPEGGMFIWATFPEDVDTAALFKIAVAHGVAFVPGESFFANDAPKNTARLNYTAAHEAEILEGVARLAKAYKTYCENNNLG